MDENVVDREFDSDNEADDDDDDWNETEECQEPTKCLFNECDTMNESIEKAIVHLEHCHHINLSCVKQQFNLDQYSYIKVRDEPNIQFIKRHYKLTVKYFQMINYIKKHNITADNMLKINEVLWNDDEYMKPVEVDPWLMFGSYFINGIKV